MIKTLAKPPLLFDYSVKPKVLYVADIPNGILDIKGHQYKKYLPQFEIDIGYSDASSEYWEDMIKEKKYDLICHQENNISDNIVSDQNKKGTQVVLTQNEVVSVDKIKSNLKKYSVFNSISANNPFLYDNFHEAGFDDIYATFDGVDLHVFGHDIPIQKRKFKVFFLSNVEDCQIWQKVKELIDRSDIEFVELSTDYFNKYTPEQMNSLYNECQVFVCLSENIHYNEASACGCVPVTTKIGYCDYFKNLFIVDKNPEACAEKIIHLKDNPEILFKMSKGISKEILPWHDKFTSQHWGYFIQQSLLKKKGIQFI
jgi:glycosyltransferase involved in cell wall biosynthesis